MVLLHRSPISVGRRGVFYSFKWFLPPWRKWGGGGVRHPLHVHHRPASGDQPAFQLSGLPTCLPVLIRSDPKPFALVGSRLGTIIQIRNNLSGSVIFFWTEIQGGTNFFDIIWTFFAILYLKAGQKRPCRNTCCIKKSLKVLPVLYWARFVTWT